MKFLLHLIALLLLFLAWATRPVEIGPGIAEVCPERYARTMAWYGPGYNYRIMPDGELQVWRGEWLRLGVR